MLIYIYMNQRVLDKNNSILLSNLIKKTQEEQIQLKKLLLPFTEGSDKDISDNINIRVRNKITCID